MKLHMYTDPNSDHPMAKYRYKTVNGHHSISTTPTIHSSSVANSVATTSVVALATEVTIVDSRKQSGMCSQLWGARIYTMKKIKLGIFTSMGIKFNLYNVCSIRVILNFRRGDFG